MSSGPVRAGIENINSTMKANLVILLAATTAVVMVAVLQRPEPGGNPTPSAISSAPRAGSAAGPLPVVAATAAVVVPSPGTNSLPPGLAGFAAWTGGFLAESNPALRAAALAQGETLALARREEITRLIQSDPKRALELAVPMAVRGQLPPEITRHLEERLSGRGAFGRAGGG